MSYSRKKNYMEKRVQYIYCSKKKDIETKGNPNKVHWKRKRAQRHSIELKWKVRST